MNRFISKLKDLHRILFGDSLYVPLLILFTFWTGLGPPSAMILALNSNSFNELEHLLLLLSFAFVLPISLIQLMFMEEVFPKTNREILKELLLPILLVLFQSLITDISFLTGFIMINLSDLSSRLLGHISALVMEPSYNKKVKRNLHEHLSLITLYIPMLIPVFIFGEHLVSIYKEAALGTTSILFWILVLSFLLPMFLNSKTWYHTFKSSMHGSSN